MARFKRDIVVGVMPTFSCNNRCAYCYIPNAFKEQKAVGIDPFEIGAKLSELEEAGYRILKANIYGGEISLLSVDYLKALRLVLTKWYTNDIWVTSNLHNVERLLDAFKDDYISTSLNPDRPDIEYVRDTLKKLKDDPLLKHPIDGLVTATPAVLNTAPKTLLDSCEGLGLGSVNVLRFYPSVGVNNHYGTTVEQYAEYIKGLVTAYEGGEYSFELLNKTTLDEVLKRQSPSPSTRNYIYLMPNNCWAIVDYTADNLEYFRYVTLAEYEEFVNQETKRYIAKCGACPWFDRCYTEHIGQEKCSGCKEMLDWWASRGKVS